MASRATADAGAHRRRIDHLGLSGGGGGGAANGTSAAGGARVRVRVITFNLGDNRRTLDEWKADVSQWAPLSGTDYDVLLVALQEDLPDAHRHGKLHQALAEVLGARAGMREVAYATTTPLVRTQPFAVKAIAFARPNVVAATAARTQCLGKSALHAQACAKGSAGVRLQFAGVHAAVPPLVFVASHLPIDTSKDDLGYAERVHALNQSIDSVVVPLAATYYEWSLIWAGDLNFRVGADGADQLTTAIARNAFNIGLRENTPLLRQFAPTCKMVVCDDRQCPVCRMQPHRAGADATCYKTATKKGHRVPSHCDRVLYSGNNVEQVAYTAFTSPAVRASDHNAVVSDLVLSASSASS